MAIPGTIYRNGSRWWWVVKLPGETVRKPRPLIPEGGSFATNDYDVAKTLAAEIYRRAVRREKSGGDTGLSMADLVSQYLDHCRIYYSGSREVSKVELATSVLLAAQFEGRAVATLPAESMGPLMLKAVRQRMIDGEHLPGATRVLCRTTINQRTAIIRRMFKWASSEQLVPASIYHGLCSVAGLKAGRSAATEPVKVPPIAGEWVNRTRAVLPKVLSDMIEFQLLTGMRSGEICRMRPCDIDRKGEIWIYEPEKHKTAHHGHSRVVAIGPKAQKVLAPYLLRAPAACCFTPIEAMQQRLAERRAKRKTPVQPSQIDRSKENPQRKPREFWTPGAYGKAIAKAILSTNTEAAAKDPKAQLIPHWHPHQLRHTAATTIRRHFGLDVARAVLGQKSLAIAEVYAEMDRAAAEKAVKKLG